MDLKNYTLSVLAENQPGVLARVSNLISSRGFNIASLTVGETVDPKVSCMTIAIDCDRETAEQLIKQLNKLVEIIQVRNLTDEGFVSRELVLLRVKAAREDRTEILEIAQIFKANVVDVGPRSVVLEVTGKDTKIQAIVDLLKPFGIQEMIRTGRVAMLRGKK